MYNTPYSLPNNLSTLRGFYIVKAVFCFLATFFGLIFILIGAKEIATDFSEGIKGITIGILFTLVAITLGVLYCYMAKFLSETKKYQFVYVMAIISCFGTVLGILLGVFTIIELNKPHVKALFLKNDSNNTSNSPYDYKF